MTPPLAISSPHIWITSGRMTLKLEVVQGVGERTTVRMISVVQEAWVIVLSTREARDDPMYERKKSGMTLKYERRKRGMTLYCFRMWVASGSRFWRPRCEASRGCPLAMHGHIETSLTMPRQLYRLFNTSVDFEPFSTGLSLTAWKAYLVAYHARERLYFGRLGNAGEPIRDCVGVDNLLGSVLCPLNLLEIHRFCIAEVALVCFASWRLLGVCVRGCPGACCGRRPFLLWMTGSVPVSFARVTYYGDLRENFNKGCPSIRCLSRLCCHELQLGMSQCTSLAEDVLVRALTGDAPVYVAWKWSSWVDDVRDGLGVNSSPIVFCGSNVECMLERCALEADGHACLLIEMVALKVCGSFGCFRFRLHREYLLVEPFPTKWKVGRAYPLVGGATTQMTFAAGELGHALSIGAITRDHCGGRVRNRCRSSKELDEKCLLS
ncbi:hypothetical protein CRG98_005129 [Punica granatum]|uniref:Uncharacterized protein n=1 Tax=Punica granatum TaxID=22663 RepID=A0A2I0L1C7_PUNGR|nr:hypothetical protein CRG98_005129 [Punica granatum]